MKSHFIIENVYAGHYVGCDVLSKSTIILETKNGNTKDRMG